MDGEKIHRRRKLKKSDAESNMYFTKEHEDAICKYKYCTNLKERDKIYEEYIYPAFKLIVENLTNVYKIFNVGNIEDIKNECISFMTEKISLYDENRGYKAFSFFSVIAKNWLIQQQKRINKEHMSMNEICSIRTIGLCVEETPEEILLSQENTNDYFMNSIYKWENSIRKNTILYQVYQSVCVFMASHKNYSYSSYNRKSLINFVSQYTGIDEKRVSVALYRLRKNAKI